MPVTPGRMREVDAKYESPKQRAERVYAILKQHPEITSWDCLCFAIEWIAYQAADPQASWLEKPAREAARLIYTMHYEFAEQLYGGSASTAEIEVKDAKRD